MGTLTGRATGEVRSGDQSDSYSFAGSDLYSFAESGHCVIDGSELECELVLNWGEVSSVVTGNFKIMNGEGELRARFYGTKDYPGRGAVISAIIEEINATGAFAPLSGCRDGEFRYSEGEMEFSVF